MTVSEKVQPCDKILVPVFHTFAGEKGLRVDKDMFDESFVICLRWQDSHRRTHHSIVEKPGKWYDQRNYYDPVQREWRYD